MIRPLFVLSRVVPGTAETQRYWYGLILRMWVGSTLSISLIALLDDWSMASHGMPLLLGSFGASAVLVFGACQSPLAQPRNVVGGHFLSALVGVACYLLLPQPLAVCVAVPTAIAVMLCSGTLHPPGGATALIAASGNEAVRQMGFAFAFIPCLLGALIMVAIALVSNNWGGQRRYPVNWW